MVAVNWNSGVSQRWIFLAQTGRHAIGEICSVIEVQLSSEDRGDGHRFFSLKLFWPLRILASLSSRSSTEEAS